MKPIQPDLKFVEDGHRYTWKGRVVPSVTQVLSRVGVITPKQELDEDGKVKTVDEWTPVGFNPAHIKEDKLERSAEFGREFHKVAAWTLQGMNCKYDPQMEPWIEQFRRFINDYDGLDIAEYEGERLVECPLYSEKYGYCGTFDAVGKTKGGRGYIIYDWKTGSAKESFWPLQLAAYAQLVSENFGFASIYGTVVRFAEDKYQIFPVLGKFDKYMTEFQKFNSCLNVYKMVRGD